MKKQWNKDMRDQLKDFPKKAPEGLLDDIKSEMTRRGLSPAPVADKPKHLYPLILRRVASVAAVLLILLGLSHLWEKSATLPGLTEHMEAPLEPILPLAPLPSGLIAQAEKPASRPLEIPRKKEEESVTEVQAEAPQEKNEEKEEEQPQSNDTQEAKKEYAKTSPKPKWTYNVSSRKKSSFSFGVYYSAQGELNLNAEELLESNITTPPSDNPNGNNGNRPPDGNTGNNGGGDVSNQPDTTSVVLSRSSRSTYDIKNFRGTATHHLPVKLGLSIRYDLSERWNLQSGLVYSYLASDLEEYKYEGTYIIKQKLHYLGIPLQVGYRIWENKRFRSYLTAGGQVETLVSGKASIRHSKDGRTKTSTQNVSDNHLQFSTLASIGIEYAIGKEFSLYAEPGVHYYFKNGNKLQTYYNENPLNINLTIGFRFHWKK
jgi:hypothetical protein